MKTRNKERDLNNDGKEKGREMVQKLKNRVRTWTKGSK